MKKILLLITSIFIFSSCSTQKNIIIDFKIENKETLKEYLLENKIEVDNNDLYSIKDYTSFLYFNNNDKLQVPEILFFNSNGYLVKNRFNNNECSLVINDIQKINSLEFDKNISIDELLKNISPLYKNSNETEKYYVVINWAKFVGKINTQSFDWYKELKKSSTKSSVNCIMLNLDIQESWNLNEQQKKSLNIE